MAGQFIQRPQATEPSTTVEAMKYDAGSVEAVAEWYPADTFAMVSDAGDVTTYVESTQHKIVPLRDGEWLVRNGVGALVPTTPEAFDAGYGPAN